MNTTMLAIFLQSSISGYSLPVAVWSQGQTVPFVVDTSLSANLPYNLQHGPDLTNNEMGYFVDRATWAWTAYGRANLYPYNWGFSDVPNFFFNDGQNSITHAQCPPIGDCPPAEAIWGTGPLGTNYDIIFYENSGADWVTWENPAQWPTQWDGAPGEDDLHRTLVHEIGHALGFFHPAAALCDRTDTANEGPVMCQANGRQTDVPTFDDWLGLGTVYGRRNGPVSFEYFALNGSSTNELYYVDTTTYSTSYTTLVNPTISCTTDAVAGPDCAVGLITNDVNRQVQWDTFYGSAGHLTGRQSTARLNNSSILAPDTSFKYRNGGGEIVGAYRDHANVNRVWLVRWRPGDSTITQWNTNVSSQVEPRVAFNETENRYYAVVVSRNRTIQLFVSQNDASSWTNFQLTDSDGSANGLSRTFLPVGLVCDAHSNEANPPSCRVYYLPYSSDPLHRVGTIRRCNIVNNAMAGCANTDVTGVSIADAADYGNGAPSGWPAGPNWLLSVRNNDTTSTRLYVDNESQFALQWVDTEFVHSYTYNPVSLDWCEYLDRVIVARQ